MKIATLAGNLIVRFFMLFMKIERQPCNHPDCRCKQHEAIVVSRLGWYALGVFVIANMILMRLCLR